MHKATGSLRQRSIFLAMFATAQALVLDTNQRGWRLPRFKMPGTPHPHHSNKECARRRLQLQHTNQVSADLKIKKLVIN